MNTEIKDKTAAFFVAIGGMIVFAIITGIFIGVTWKVATWIIN